MRRVPCWCLLLCLAMAGCRMSVGPAAVPAAPSEGLIGTGEASLYYHAIADRTIVVYFAGPLNLSSRSSQNTRSGDYAIDVTLSADGDGPKEITVVGGSGRPQSIRIKGQEYELRDGTVFRVSPTGEVTQLPFAGLPPSKEYVNALHEYFQKGSS